METTYYNLDARRVSVCDMASGESAPHRESYAVLRKVEQRRAGEPGKVLDLEAYRRKLSDADDASAEDCAPVAPSISTSAAPTVSTHARSVPRQIVPLFLEACASLAIITMAVVVVGQFLRFF